MYRNNHLKVLLKILEDKKLIPNTIRSSLVIYTLGRDHLREVFLNNGITEWQSTSNSVFTSTENNNSKQSVPKINNYTHALPETNTKINKGTFLSKWHRTYSGKKTK